jgi:hypothetical protein
MNPNSNDAPRAAHESDVRARAERHADEAERLLASRWLTARITGVGHATLAVYYASRLKG